MRSAPSRSTGEETPLLHGCVMIVVCWFLFIGPLLAYSVSGNHAPATLSQAAEAPAKEFVPVNLPPPCRDRPAHPAGRSLFPLAPLPLCMVFLGLQMEALVSVLPYAEIALSILLIVGVVLQQRGATLGGAFGGDNFASTFYKRRGAEKFLFYATIVIAVLLVLAAIANFLLSGI